MGLRLAFNDMFGKGFDSAKQESFCFQKWEEEGNPTSKEQGQFWWVPEVFDIHGHAWNWDGHKRDQEGKYLSFPEGKKANLKQRIRCLAILFPQEMGECAQQLLSSVDILPESE